ncbi:MAG: HEAT repeat domain-containing protein, partial [bacterium]|nr:HEAT repeat domain-containing protein [bacterium]
MFSRCASCWLLVMIIQALVLNIAQALESSDWKYWKLQLSAPAAADRARAAFELAKLGPQAEEAMDELFVCLTDGHPQVRLQAAQALGYLALRTNEALPHLLLLLDDSDEHVRYASEWAIARLAITPVDQHEIASRLADLRRAVELMRSRAHHARHRQVIEQAIGQLDELATPSVAVEPPVELNQQQIERQRILAQLESLRARFFLGDVMERLAMIELLCEAYQDPELERARRSVQVDLIDQAYRRSDLAVLKYAESFWGSEIADSARSRLLPSVLRMSETPDWSVPLLSDCRPGSEAEILALTDIALDIRHNIPLRCAALECLSQLPGEPPASCIAAVSSIAGNQPCEPRVRLAAIETLGLLLDSSPSRAPLPALEKLLLDPNEDWELRLACLEVFAALRQQPVEPATQFF